MKKISIKKIYKVIAIYSIYIVLSLAIWRVYDDDYIIVLSLLSLLAYFILSWLIKLLVQKLKKVPGSGFNLKLAFAFIFMSSLPLVLVLYFSTSLINQFIQDNLRQSFAESIGELKNISTKKLYSHDFIEYVKSGKFIVKAKYIYKKKNI